MAPPHHQSRSSLTAAQWLSKARSPRRNQNRFPGCAGGAFLMILVSEVGEKK